MFFVYPQVNFKTVLFQTIQFSKSTASMSKTVVCLNVKTVQSQAIQFSISTQFNYFLPIERTLSHANSPGYSLRRVLHLYREAICSFYTSSRQGKAKLTHFNIYICMYIYSVDQSFSRTTRRLSFQ